jgi:hypothetical protein
MLAGMGLAIGETARRVGNLRHLELVGYEVLGAWASTPAAGAAPEAAVTASSLAHHHADRAAQLAAALPTVGDLAPPAVTRAASPGVAAFARLLAGSSEAPPPGAGGVAGPDRVGVDAPEFLAAHVRCVLARLAVGYAVLARALDPVASAPMARVLRLAGCDLADDRRRGEELVQRLLVDPDAVARAGGRTAALEASLVAAGGLHGVA